MITIICALAENNAIGLNNQLLYPLRNDLRRFKALTTGHTIIMGRNTYESLPKGALPNRRTIVVSRTVSEPWPNTEVATSLEQAIALAGDAEIFIIGGAQLYAAAMPLAHQLCLTHVHAKPPAADAFFPVWDETQWHVTFREDHPADEIHPVAYSFINYLRNE